jgi:hypothetical protein
MNDNDVAKTEKEFKEAFEKFSDLVSPTGEERSRLWVSWHFLQVYSVWGLGLPSTEATLKPALYITDNTSESFSAQLLEGNKKIKSACELFQQKLFPKMISLATGILSHSELGSPADKDGKGGADMFGLIKAMVNEGNKSTAFHLLQVMEDSVVENLKSTADVEELIGVFYTKLVDAKGSIEGSEISLDADDNTSTAALTKLNGDENTEGSLAYIQKNLQDKQAEYQKAVAIAATTPTYAWITVPIPIGPVAAVIVAGVYGNEAVQVSDQIEKFQTDFKKASAQLRMALASQATVKSGRKQIDYSLDLLEKAKEHTTTIRNGWNGMATALTGLKGLLAAATPATNLNPGVSNLLDLMASKWKVIYPVLADLVNEPYINVKPDGEDMKTLAKDVKSQAKAA